MTIAVKVIEVREHFRSRPKKKTPAQRFAEKQAKQAKRQRRRKKPQYF